MDPVPDPLLRIKSGSAGNRTRDLCIWSQKLWPLDHRGGELLTLGGKKKPRYATVHTRNLFSITPLRPKQDISLQKPWATSDNSQDFTERNTVVGRSTVSNWNLVNTHNSTNAVDKHAWYVCLFKKLFSWTTTQEYPNYIHFVPGNAFSPYLSPSSCHTFKLLVSNCTVHSDRKMNCWNYHLNNAADTSFWNAPTTITGITDSRTLALK